METYNKKNNRSEEHKHSPENESTRQVLNLRTEKCLKKKKNDSLFFSYNKPAHIRIDRLRFIPAILVIGFLFQRCSTPVYVQKDDTINLSGYHSYMWVDTKKNEKDDSKKATAYADISIHNAVNAELKKAGWKETENEPDALLSYDVLVERAVEKQSDPVYSQSFTRSYYNPYRKSWATIYYPSQFLGYDVYNEPVKNGTITINIMDSKTDKNIWQGWTTERLNYTRLTDDEISQSVKNIFRKFEKSMK